MLEIIDFYLVVGGCVFRLRKESFERSRIVVLMLSVVSIRIGLVMFGRMLMNSVCVGECLSR